MEQVAAMVLDSGCEERYRYWGMDGRLYVLLYLDTPRNYLTSLTAVYRVHWLRAKAQKMRWIEELQCLQVEMKSAVRFFRHQEQFWGMKREFIDHQLQPGHAAWAARQSAMWCSIGMNVESKFTALVASDPPPKFAKVSPPPLYI